MGEVAPELRDPLTYSNWVWLLGGALIVLALAWVVALIILYRVRLVARQPRVKTLGQLQRARYNRHIQEVESGFAAAEISARDAHFALAALIRAAATEKTGVNIESQTTTEVARNFAGWPELLAALQWCEDETFPGSTSERVERGVAFAKEVVNE